MNADLAELDDLTEEERNPDWLKDKGEYVLYYTAHTHTTPVIFRAEKGLVGLFCTTYISLK